MKPMESKKGIYPYVIRRAMATVYQKLDVRFSSANSGIEDNRVVLVKFFHNPYDANGNLTMDARDALVETILEISMHAKPKLRMCAVFAEDDAVYVAPDGRVRPSNEPPSGGIQF